MSDPSLFHDKFDRISDDDLSETYKVPVAIQIYIDKDPGHRSIKAVLEVSEGDTLGDLEDVLQSLVESVRRGDVERYEDEGSNEDDDQ